MVVHILLWWFWCGRSFDLRLTSIWPPFSTWQQLDRVHRHMFFKHWSCLTIKSQSSVFRVNYQFNNVHSFSIYCFRVKNKRNLQIISTAKKSLPKHFSQYHWPLWQNLIPIEREKTKLNRFIVIFHISAAILPAVRVVT